MMVFRTAHSTTDVIWNKNGVIVSDIPDPTSINMI